MIAIFAYLIFKGASSLNFAFFTQIPKPEGEPGGGMANAIVGSGVLLALASLVMEVGLVAGVKLPSPFYLWTAPAWLAWYLFAAAAIGKVQQRTPALDEASA